MKMMRTIGLILMLGIALNGLIGCANLLKNDPAAKLGTGVIFTETQKGGEPSTVRMFVHKDFMRIDPFPITGSYILFNRKKQVIYNVSANDKTIRIIKKQKNIPHPPVEIKIEEEESPSNLLDEGQSNFYRVKVNGEKCHNVVAAPNMLKDVVDAFKEYRTILATEKALNLSVAKGEPDLCEWALSVEEPTYILEHGFPVRQWSEDGYQRFIIESNLNIKPSENLNVLPKGHKRYMIKAKN
jgi:hypothetical protein